MDKEKISFEEIKAIALEELDNSKNPNEWLERIVQSIYQKGKESTLMTNKEWMATLTAEQVYDVMWWLFNKYAFRFTHSQMAIIDWLDETHKSAQESEPFNPPHNN